MSHVANLSMFGQRHRHPIFTLPMLSGRTYIVADPALCAALQRASTVLNFDPIVVAVLPCMVGVNDHTVQTIKGPPGQKYKDGMMKASHHIINTPLLPQNIKDASKAQVDYYGRCIARIQDGSNIDLNRFVRDTVTTATQNTFFGPNNAFENDPELVESFWNWEAGLIPYMVGVLPRIFVRKATRGINACVNRFKQYIDADGFKDAHKILQDRQILHRSNGITDKNELARLEVSISLGFVINASITSFWLLDQVFSRPALLSKIREEIHANALIGPRLLSETLRLIMPAISARFVAEDITIADTWLLRKGSVVQLAGNVIHFNLEIWGPDCDTFNPDRFLYSPNGSSQIQMEPSPRGKLITCVPVLGLAAVMIMGFDMKPTNDTKWNPSADAKRLPFVVPRPTEQLDVKIKVRKEFKDVTWEMKP
ncbi:hypothetical protein E8E11_011637 [Didymella keratinophila]|nr:hypothetical protein E8E11_011637 [Didymella keratinophila]